MQTLFTYFLNMHVTFHRCLNPFYPFFSFYFSFHTVNAPCHKKYCKMFPPWENTRERKGLEEILMLKLGDVSIFE